MKKPHYYYQSDGNYQQRIATEVIKGLIVETKIKLSELNEEIIQDQQKRIASLETKLRQLNGGSL